MNGLVLDPEVQGRSLGRKGFLRLAAVLGLERAEGTILKVTLLPAAVFAVIASVVSFAL